MPVTSDDNPVLVYSPVLNFEQSNLLIGAQDDVIKRHGVEFFYSNSVKVAKTLLWQLCLGHDDCPIWKGTNALVGHFSNIITLLKSLDKTDTDVPTFVIKRPTEVPCHCLHLFILKI